METKAENRSEIVEIEALSDFRKAMIRTFGETFSIAEIYCIWDDVSNGCNAYKEYRSSLWGEDPKFETTIISYQYEIRGEMSRHLDLCSTSDSETSFLLLMDQYLRMSGPSQDAIAFLFIPEDDPLSYRELGALEKFLSKMGPKYRILLSVIYSEEIADIQFVIYTKINN